MDASSHVDHFLSSLDPHERSLLNDLLVKRAYLTPEQWREHLAAARRKPSLVFPPQRGV